MSLWLEKETTRKVVISMENYRYSFVAKNSEIENTSINGLD
jgi:hypothetical protein